MTDVRDDLPQIALALILVGNVACLYAWAAKRGSGWRTVVTALLLLSAAACACVMSALSGLVA